MKFRQALTYDDVLLVPTYSNVESRSNVDTSVTLTNGFKFNHPIIPANMQTVTGPAMAQFIVNSFGLAIMHRFMPVAEQLSYVQAASSSSLWREHVGFSVGIKKEDKDIVDQFLDAGAKIICVDVAHGDSKLTIEMVQHISKRLDKTGLVIAGNVATPQGAQRLWEAGAHVVKVGVGPGCFAAGTRILMSNGFYKNIEDIVCGDLVINKDGVPVKVVNAFSTGIRKVSKIRNNIFYNDTYVTAEHQFWVGDLSSVSKQTLAARGYSKILDKKSKTIPKRSKYKWKCIADAKNDALLFPKQISFDLPETFEIAIQKRSGGNWRAGEKYENDVILVPTYETGYIFGTFLGDGNASCTNNNGSHSGRVSWYFGKNELDIANKVLDCIKASFGKEAKLEFKKSTINVVFYYKPFADLLNKWGEKTNKHLPIELLTNNKDYLRGIFDGLVDSDGCRQKDGRISLGNTSIQIIELFNIVSYMLTGVMPNSLKENISIGGLKNCNIDNCNQSYTSTVLKNGKVRLTNNYQVVKLLEYKELDVEMPVYDITVDCESHSFIANNMIVHNSLCTTRIETGNGVPQLTAVMDVAEAAAQMKVAGKYHHFIADGGIKSAGDCVKALCFADMIMVGNMFAGTEEAPGELVVTDHGLVKRYVGSSTHKTNHIEGVEATVSYKGTAQFVLEKILEGIKSGCSYQGCDTIKDLKQSPEFVQITSAGLKESHPHDVIVR